MSGDYDNNDSDDRGSNSYGHSYSSSGREEFGKTSSFSTMGLSEDGRFFGVKLAPELAEKARQLYPTALTYLTDKGEDVVTKALKTNFGGKYAKYGSLAGYAIALSSQIYQTGENVYDSVKALNDLRVAVHPLKSAGHAKGAAPLSSNNEVVANARSKISGIFWQRMIQTAVSTIGAAPALINKFNKQSIKRQTAKLDDALNAAHGDPDKIAELYEKELTGTLTTKPGQKALSTADLQMGKARYIEKQAEAYQAKFDAFKLKNNDVVTRELEEALKIDTNNYRQKIRKLESFGVNTEELVEELKGVKRWDDIQRTHVYTAHAPDAKKAIIDKFVTDIKGTTKGALSQFTEEGLKTKFVQQEGAWDNTWRVDHSNDQERQLTHREKIEQDLRNIEEGRRKTEQEELSASKSITDDSSKTIKDMGWGLAAGFTGEFFTKLIGGKALDQYKKPIALDYILNLRRAVEPPKDTSDWKPPEEVPPIAGNNNRREGGNESLSYVRYVHEIFQQHQKDSKRVEIGGRFVQHFENEQWNDAAIQKMSDDELTPYEYALKTIAKRIKDGRMDAIALVDLVGDSHGNKLVQSDGRTFGPRGAGKEDAAIKKAMLRLIDEKTALIHASQVKTDEQVNDKLGNFIFSVEDMKKALESNDLEKGERAFIFTLFSDVVGSDDKLCQKLGIKNERCQELRKESKEQFNITLDGVVDVLDEMIEKNPEELEKILKITDKEKKLIRSLKETEKADGKHVADLTKDREEIAALETLAANAAMMLSKEPAKSDGDSKQKSFWQRVKHRIEELKKPKESKEAKESKEEKEDRKAKRNPDSDRDFDSDTDRDHEKVKSGDNGHWDEGKEDPKESSHHSFDSEDSPDSDSKPMSFADRERNNRKSNERNGADRKWAKERPERTEESFSARERLNKAEKESASLRGGPS